MIRWFHQSGWLPVLLVASLFTALPSPAAASRPNLIFLLTDDHRQDALGAYGNALIHTPQLDRMAAEGVTFNRAFVTTAICMTSRASILAGQYAARHGIWRFDTGFTPGQLAQTYPGMLKAAGYRTGFIGKWGVGSPPTNFFDFNTGFPGQGSYLLKVNGADRHLDSVLGDQALEFLAGAKRDQPFCLSVSFKAPHVDDSANTAHSRPFPHDPALEHLYQNITIPVPALNAPQYFEQLPVFLQNSEARARWAIRFWSPARYQDSVKSYYRLISGVDVVVGRIREKLQELGADRDTVIVFTSDHGFYLGEYGLAGKWFPHELSLRVPLIVFDPRLPPERRGRRRDELVLNLDIAPTLLDAAGVTPPATMQGRSLLPLVRGESPGWRTEFFYEHLFDHPGLPKSEAVRTERWKYMRFVETQPVYEALYDLERDPGETSNLADTPENHALLDDLRARHERLRAAAR